MEYKKFEIRTVNDIFKMINKDNIVDFCSDFNASLVQFVEMKNILKKDEVEGLEYECFTWIDDKKREITLNFEEKVK